MRKILIALPLLACATPSLAQEPVAQLPPELSDPATFQRLAGQMQAVSHALLDIRIGEIGAALQGREATPRERRLTIGDLARRKDPDFDRHIAQQVATVGPKLQRSVQAVNRALPQMQRALDQAQRSFERAVANMPDPNYPIR